ncbi:Hypothetical protein NTJ_00246 [Nesidiocoris tenuis]|uniref:Secreted protein n=1 Tax=Nesidiocoris tenuis TaxID=355587 RepID=A0ABN7A5V4_9HEMI|nr:Hypothetical protein NTJ_00246 [Nesidiocoris tenuis]
MLAWGPASCGGAPSDVLAQYSLLFFCSLASAMGQGWTQDELDWLLQTVDNVALARPIHKPPHSAPVLLTANWDVLLLTSATINKAHKSARGSSKF